MRYITIISLMVTMTVALVAFYLADPLFIRAPSDAAIATSFRDHRDEFLRLQKMVREDKIGYLSSGNLEEIKNPVRRKEYENLFAIVPGNIKIARAAHSTRFILVDAGLAAIGAGWLKGLEAFDDNQTPQPEVVSSLDNAFSLPSGNAYLKRLEENWYIFLQKTD